MGEFISKYKKHIISVTLLFLCQLLLLVFYVNKKPPESSLRKIDEKITIIANSQEKLISIVDDLHTSVVKLAENDSIMNIQLLHYPAQQPISRITKISSVYQERIDPITRDKRFHWGIDYAANKGTDVMATATGTVIQAEFNAAYGNEVILDHANGYQSLYAHLDSIYVKPGYLVNRGEVIGTVGNTGRTTGNHLHYEVSLLDKKINPDIFR